MKNTVALFSLLLLSHLAFSQQGRPGGARGPGGEGGNATLTGSVQDESTGLPLEFATISLLSAVDTVIVTGGVSEPNGKFSIDAPFGKYFVKVEFLAYESKMLPAVALSPSNKKFDLGKIDLGPSAEMLAEVEVRAEKSELQFSLDKRVFNVGKDLANRGGAADDILDNIPSVTVDAEGEVSLRGSSNVRILVDGKPSGLVGIGDSDGLKSMPANMIEKVEIITNASARYEAEGTTGIINIILKKDKDPGVNGSIDITAGVPQNYGLSVNLNARKKKINYFLNYGFRNRTGPGLSSTDQEFFGDIQFPFNEQVGERNRGGVSHSVRGGMDLFLTEKDVLTGSISYRYGNDFSNSLTTFKDFDANRTLQEISTRSQDEVETEPNLEYDLRFVHSFAKEGQKLTAQVQYQNSSEVETADFVNEYFNGEGNPSGRADQIQRSENDEGSENLLFQIDYVHPFSKNRKFEIGSRVSLRDIGNDYFLETLDDGVWTKLPRFTNDFVYNEDIYAAYAIFGDKISKWSYQLGLRLEHSDVTTELRTTSELNDRSYTNLFPSAHLTYEIDPGNSLQLSYSSRISRPRFWYLNPFFTFSNDRRIWGGNPNLDPEFTDSYELGYLRYFDNVTFGSSLYYRHTTGVIERITTAGQEEGTTFTRPQNLAIEDAVGFELTTTADVTKKLRFDLSANIYRSVTEGVFQDQQLSAEAFTMTTRLNARYSFWDDADIQIRADYRAPSNTTQGRRLASGGVDVAFSKDFLKKKATFTINARDIFFTRIYRYITDTDDLYSESLYQRRNRSISASFSYRINQKKQRRRGGGGNYEGGGDEGGF